jgi:hypothetical protein
MIRPMSRPMNLIDRFREQSEFGLDMEAKQLDNILNHYKGISEGVKAQYAPQMSQEELRKIQLLNAIQQIKNQFAPQREQAGLNNTLASIGVKNRQSQRLDTINQYLPHLKELALQKALMENQAFPQKQQREQTKHQYDVEKRKAEIKKLNMQNEFAPTKQESDLQKAEAYIKSMFAGIPFKEQQAIGQWLKNEASPEMNAAKLKNTQLGNEKKEIENKYLPLEKQANTGIKQSKAQYAPQTDEANLKRIQSGNELTAKKIEKAGVENNYLEREKELKYKMDTIKKEMEELKKEQLPQKLENETTRANAQANYNSPENLKKRYSQKTQKISAAIDEIEKTGLDPVTGQPLTERQKTDKTRDLQMALDKELVSPEDQRFLGTIGTTMALYKKLDLPAISKHYGGWSFAKRTGQRFLGPLGYNDKKLNEFDKFINQIANTQTEGMRKAFSGSVQPTATKKWRDQIVPKMWSSPEAALAFLHGCGDILDEELASKLKNAPRQGYYRQVRFRGVIPGDNNPQKSNTSQNLTPEQKASLSKAASELLASSGG